MAIPLETSGGPNAAVLLTDIGQISAFVTGDTVTLVAKVVVLVILLLYVLFALTALIQIRRLQSWLMSLEPYHFPRYALIHLGLSIVGWLVALIVL